MARGSPKTFDIANMYSWSALNLFEIFLLLNNKNIQEIFCYKINNPIIITHSKLGRLKTNIKFTQQLGEAIRILSELNANKILTTTNTSIKTGFLTNIGNLRISIQIPPLTYDTMEIIIRRLPENPYTLQKLIADNQITMKQASFLLNCIKLRKNIVIGGEPGSGKTTLANALLLNCNKTWRIIILEDANELNFPNDNFPNIIRYHIPSIGEKGYKQKRIDEITKILFRSPDYIFFGEIQNKEDSNAVFEGLSAGIRGISTIHTKNFDSLMSRWKDNHSLTLDQINAIDVIVTTKRRFDGIHFKIQIDQVYENVLNEFVCIGERNEME